jgi:hypothetical protein
VEGRVPPVPELDPHADAVRTTINRPTVRITGCRMAGPFDGTLRR